jgi:hypothetical protein
MAAPFEVVCVTFCAFVIGAVAAWLPPIIAGMIYWPGAHGWDVGIPAIITALIGGCVGVAVLDDF